MEQKDLKKIKRRELLELMLEQAKRIQELELEIKDLKMYLKPEDNACYYVANGNLAGKVDLY